jgi:predicted nucleic acid-binding protein
VTLVGVGEARCLLDNSAYARAGIPGVGALLSQAAASGQLMACGAFVSEALYSARDGREAEAIEEELTLGMPYVETGDEAWRLAARAQVELARVSARFHRRPPIDFLIAAVAHVHGVGVLHYDHDYDLVAEHSTLEFESRWIAEPGTL